MKTSLWLVPAVAVVVLAGLLWVVGSYVAGPEEDSDDPAGEPIDETDYEYEEEFQPILATAVDYGTLETLMRLLQRSGYDKELAGDGPFTLLAPDDSAFAQLQPRQREMLKSDREYLKAVLSRHIIKGHRVVFGDELQTMTIKCIKGDVITAEVADDGVQIEQAWVIDEQIECSNGVIHVIDAVLLPPKGSARAN